jgi:hypothetical protein
MAGCPKMPAPTRLSGGSVSIFFIGFSDGSNGSGTQVLALTDREPVTD